MNSSIYDAFARNEQPTAAAAVAAQTEGRFVLPFDSLLVSRAVAEAIAAQSRAPHANRHPNMAQHELGNITTLARLLPSLIETAAITSRSRGNMVTLAKALYAGMVDPDRWDRLSCGYIRLWDEHTRNALGTAPPAGVNAGIYQEIIAR